MAIRVTKTPSGEKFSISVENIKLLVFPAKLIQKRRHCYAGWESLGLLGYYLDITIITNTTYGMGYIVQIELMI